MAGRWRDNLALWGVREWAMTAEDALWRRTKMGLRMDADVTAGVTSQPNGVHS